MCQHHNSQSRRSFFGNLASFFIGTFVGATVAKAPKKDIVPKPIEKDVTKVAVLSSDWTKNIKWDDDRLAEDLKRGKPISNELYIVNRPIPTLDVILYNCNFVCGPDFGSPFEGTGTGKMLSCYFSYIRYEPRHHT